MLFKSSLLGSLGVDVFVGPNLIDFGTVFDDFAAKLLENAAVVGTVIGIIILYIPLAVLCRRFDKKDKVKVRPGFCYKSLCLFCFQEILSKLKLLFCLKNLYIEQYRLFLQISC